MCLPLHVQSKEHVHLCIKILLSYNSMLIKGYVAQIKIKMKQRPNDTKTTLKQIHISFVGQPATHILVTTTLQQEQCKNGQRR